MGLLSPVESVNAITSLLLYAFTFSSTVLQNTGWTWCI